MNGVKRIIPVFSLLVSLFFFYSCTTSPIAQHSTLRQPRSESIGAFEPHWQHFRTGLDFAEAVIEDVPLELRALRVDLQNPAVRIAVNSPGKKEGSVPSIKTTSFAENYRCAAAINANPFNISGTKEGVPLSVSGIAVSDSSLVSGPEPGYAALVFYKDGTPKIVQQDDLGDPSRIENAVGGFFIILKEGLFQDNISDFRKMVRHPRSAAGLSADGRYLYLLVIDGRTNSSAGATERESAEIMLKLGARDALIFDGGGSSCLALRYPDGKVRPVNTPIHNGVPGMERAVAICLGIQVLE